MSGAPLNSWVVYKKVSHFSDYVWLQPSKITPSFCMFGFILCSINCCIEDCDVLKTNKDKNAISVSCKGKMKKKWVRSEERFILVAAFEVQSEGNKLHLRSSPGRDGPFYLLPFTGWLQNTLKLHPLQYKSTEPKPIFMVEIWGSISDMRPNSHVFCFVKE